MCWYSRTWQWVLPNPCPCSHNQTLIPTHFPDSCCSFPVERGYHCISSPGGIGTYRGYPLVTLSYLARIVALILISSTQHIFGKFWKQLGTFLPIHEDHWHFHQIRFHRVSVVWPQRKHIRKVTGQQSQCWCCNWPSPRCRWASLRPTSPPPPSFPCSQPLTLYFLPVIPHSLRTPPSQVSPNNSPPPWIIPLIQNHIPASKKTSSLTPARPTDWTSWNWLAIIPQPNPASASYLPITTFN